MNQELRFMWLSLVLLGCGQRFDIETSNGRDEVLRAVNVMATVVLAAAHAPGIEGVPESQKLLDAAVDEVLKLESLVKNGLWAAAVSRLPCAVGAVLELLSSVEPDTAAYLRNVLADGVHIEGVRCG
ncbi:MAG: hypothetical protein GWN58_58515 [Anaerolineae bacterium]|nr:hypothetical protein [Anaerolineae bacterium]